MRLVLSTGLRRWWGGAEVERGVSSLGTPLVFLGILREVLKQWVSPASAVMRS